MDPRTELAHFFFPGDVDGPLGYLAMRDGKGEAVSSRAMGASLHSMLQSATTSTLPHEQVRDALSDSRSEFFFGSSAHLAMFPTSYFSVFRPTSPDALKLMMCRLGTGKGLNIKGKSAKTGVLSGFVPFLQISENDDVPKVEMPPAEARVRVYYKSPTARATAEVAFGLRLERRGSTTRAPARNKRTNSGRSSTAPLIHRLDEYTETSGVWGLELPLLLLWEKCAIEVDITPPPGWETGRKSQPAFMEMNLRSLYTPSSPKVVLYQYADEPMHPRGLLVAYEETKPHQVKPVVSDMDCFLVGSRGKRFGALPDEQVELIRWELDNIEAMLHTATSEKKRHGKAGVTPWMNGWIHRLKLEKDAGHVPPAAGPLGYGDATSSFMMSEAVTWTSAIGAVRHGPECFNFHFPQSLDDEFLVTWDGFEGGVKFRYLSEIELRKFLLERVRDGYTFPLNAKWALCDPGWFDIWQALCKAEGNRLEPWFPKESGLRKRVEGIRAKFPDGYPTSERTMDIDLVLFRVLGPESIYQWLRTDLTIKSLRVNNLVATTYRRLAWLRDLLHGETGLLRPFRHARQQYLFYVFKELEMGGWNVTPCRLAAVCRGGGNRARDKDGDVDGDAMAGSPGSLQVSRTVFPPIPKMSGFEILGPPTLFAKLATWNIRALHLALSPFAEVNLPLPNRMQAEIPLQATHFAFVYPSIDVGQLSRMHLEELGCFDDPMVDLLANGGYLYVDEQAGGQLLAINALRTRMSAADLQEVASRGTIRNAFDFDGPYPMSSAALRSLISTGRMQATTSHYAQMGVDSMAWVLPGETFTKWKRAGAAARESVAAVLGSEGKLAVGPLPQRFGAVAFARGKVGAYFRLIPLGIPHAHITVSSDMEPSKRFAPFTVEPPLDSMIAELKQMISLRTSVPVEQLKLMRAGTPLDDDLASLDNCGIRSGHAVTIHVLVAEVASKKHGSESKQRSGNLSSRQIRSKEAGISISEVISEVSARSL